MRSYFSNNFTSKVFDHLRAQCLEIILFLIEMALSGSLKTLFDARTSPSIKHGSSTITPSPVVFVPPSYFKVDGKLFVIYEEK